MKILLSKEDKDKEIEKVKSALKASYPNTKLDKLVLKFSNRKPVVIVVSGPMGGKTKVLLDGGSGLQKSFLNLSYVKKALGDTAESVINQTSVDIMKRKRELEEERRKSETKKRNLEDKNEDIQGLTQRLNIEQAKIDQLKEIQSPDYQAEIKRKDQLVKNLEKDLNAKKKEREELQKQSKNQEKVLKKIKHLQSIISQVETKRNAMEERLISTTTIDALKENESPLQQLNEEDLVIIQDELATSFDKEAAEERVAARNEELACLQTQIEERERALPLSEQVKKILPSIPGS